MLNNIYKIYKDKIEELLTRRVDKIYPSREALEKVLRSGKKLKLYQGFDPTGTQLHIGHMVGLLKLAEFQNLGHEVIFLIGDGTGQAGDPSGKKRAREKFLTQLELRQNARDYVLQAEKIVRFTGPNPVKILYNGDWLNKLTLVEILKIAQYFTLSQLAERDLFVERKKRGEEVNLREFLYPLLQAYDSVAMEVDLEVGGTDQTFNMLCGRTLVKAMLGREKFVITTPLLTDSKGQKIGKTEGNVIALNAPFNQFFGLIMSLPDSAIIPCFTLITDVNMGDVGEMREQLDKREINPMELKKKLAHTLTIMLNGQEKADQAKREFERTVQGRERPKEIPIVKLSIRQLADQIANLAITDLLLETKLCRSKSEAKRLIQQGGVEVDNKKITDPNLKIKITDGMILRCGKRKYLRIILRP